MEADEEELSLLEYTRYYGLSCDSGRESDDETEDFNDYIKSSGHKLLAATDETEQLKIGILDEKVLLDAAARTVLSSVFSLQKKSATLGVELDVRQTKKFRLEEPMLFTDAEIDVKHYRAARLKDKTDMSAGDWRSFTINDEEDQDRERPNTLLQDFTERVKKEKLEIPKESIQLLKQACAPQDVEKNRNESYELGLKYKRNNNLRPLTPPLSPVLSRPATPTTSSPGPHLDSLKWNTTPPTTNARRIVNNMLRDDNFPGYWDHSSDNIKTDDLEALYPPLGERHQPQPLSSSPPRQRASHLKLEEPLSPWNHPTNLPSEDIFTNSLPFFQIPASTLSDDDLRRTFEEIIEPGALRVQSTLRNETLKEADYTARVQVPDLDTQQPLAPWQKQYTREDELKELRELMLPIAQTKLHQWSATKLERDLVWTPFSLNVNIEEELRDVGGLVERFTRLDVSNCVKTESLTWKPEGLRLLDNHDSDDDELSETEEETRPGSSHVEVAPKVADRVNVDISTTPLIMTEANPVDRGQRPATRNVPLNFSSLLNDKVVLKPHQTSTAARTDAEPQSVFDAADELDDFMRLQGRLVKRQKRDHVPAIPFIPARSIDHTSSARSAGATTINSPTETKTADPAPPPVPLPTLLPPRQIVASSTLTANQPLFRELTKLYPDLDIIERDRIPPLQATTTFSGNASSSPRRATMSTQPIQHDADIVLSPSAGIALVPIARLHQLPLPGSAPSTSASMPGASVRAGIYALTNQHSHITVLVIVPEADINRLSKRDRDAIASLRAFASDLRRDTPDRFGTHVQVDCVSAGVVHLAHQLIALMAGKRANLQTAPPFQLMTDETQWEVWLRRAGLNAWVAQILTRGQPAVHGQDMERILWNGLQGFAAMPEQEKIATFSAALEGEAMVRRVSRAVEKFLNEYSAAG